MYTVPGDKKKALLSRNKKIYRSLMQSVGKDYLKLHFQPLYSIKDREIYGFEALLRLKIPVLGNIVPSEFIPIAEQTGLIVDIGKWCLEQACIFSNTLSLLGHKDMVISVNVSAVQVIGDTFVEDISSTLSRMQTNPNTLIIELTESALITNLKDQIHKLEQLKELGIKIAIDDFGTGYSSFSYLLDLPIDIVKIDKDFIHELIHNVKNHVAVEGIIHMAKKMGISVIAEGIETKRQLDEIIKFDCDSFQGFYLSPAIPLSEVNAFLANDFEI